MRTVNYRTNIASADRAATRAIIAAHRQAMTTITPVLDALIEHMRNAGDALSLIWLAHQPSYDTVRQTIFHAVAYFSRDAQLASVRTATQAATWGQESALAQLAATVPSGVQWAFDAPKSQPSLITRLQRLFSSLPEDTQQAATKAILVGASLGTHPDTIARQVRDICDMPLYRARTICRTETMRAYRERSTTTYQANSDVVAGWYWLATLAPDTCAACIAMHGTYHEVSEGMDSHPNCRCTQSPATHSWSDILAPLGIDASDIPDTSPAVDSGIDWFNNQDASTQQSILGNAKYAAWKAGDLDLSDIVGKRESDEWGNSIYEKSMKDVGLDPSDYT